MSNCIGIENLIIRGERLSLQVWKGNEGSGSSAEKVTWERIGNLKRERNVTGRRTGKEERIRGRAEEETATGSNAKSGRCKDGKGTENTGNEGRDKENIRKEQDTEILHRTRDEIQTGSVESWVRRKEETSSRDKKLV